MAVVAAWLATNWISVALFVISTIMQQSAAAAARDRQRRMQEEADARADAAKGTSIVVEGEVAPLRVAYGRNLVGGARVYHGTFNTYSYAAPAAGGEDFSASGTLGSSVSGSKHEFLITQQAICFSGINACYDVDIDDKKIDGEYVNEYNEVVYSGGTKITPYSYGCRARVYIDGGVADPLMTAHVANRSTAYFTNTAYATCVYRLNRDDPQFSGVPTAKFYIEGMKVHSIVDTAGIKSLSAVKEYSNNSALCLLDYLTSPIYGRGLSVDQIDLNSFYDAALICGKVVQSDVPLAGGLWHSKGGTHDVYLYECNIALDSSQELRKNIELILDTMGMAELVWSGGKYKLQLSYPSVYTDTPLITYSEGDVVQYTNGDDVGLFRALTSVDNTTEPFVGVDWADAIDFYVTDDNIVRKGETSMVWPNAQTRFNFATVRFLNEAIDFKEDTVTWPSKKGSVDGTNVDRGVWSAVAAYNTSDRVSYDGETYQLLNGSGRVSAVAPVNDPLWIVYGMDPVYAVLLQEDNGMALETDVFATGITSAYNALAKAEQMVRSSRYSVTFDIDVDHNYIEAEPGDMVKVSSVVLNIPGDLLRISAVKPNEDGTIKLSLAKFDAAMLAYNAKDDEIVPIRNLYSNDLPNIAIADIAYFDTNDTVVGSSGYITWPAVDDVRVTGYVVKTASIFEGAGTIWTDRGVVSELRFDLPELYNGSYVLTVVPTASGRKTSPKSGWPIKGIGVIQIGQITAPVRVYKRSATVPATPTDGSFNFTTNTATPPTGWSVSPPTGVDDLFYTDAVAVDDGSHVDNVLVWRYPINTNTSLYKKTIYVYARGNPEEFPTGGSWTFPDGPITVPTSGDATWYDSVPAGYLAVYSSFAVATSAVNTGANTNTLEWSRPLLVSAESSKQTSMASIYQWAMSIPSAPTATSTFVWSAMQNTSFASLGSWSATVPANPGTPLIKLYTASINIVGHVGEEFTAVDWSEAVISANTENGAGATQGTIVRVFRWDGGTVPTGPTGSPTYTWASGSFGAAPSGWALTPGTSPVPGQTLWEASIRLADSVAATTTAFNWSIASISAISTAGVVGADGADGPQGNSYRVAYGKSTVGTASTVGSVTTSGSSSFTTETYSLTGITWSASVPSLSAGDYGYQLDGIYNPTTNTTYWSDKPYLSNLKVGSLSAISANMGSITAGTLSIDSSGWVAGGQSAYNTGTGFWMGYTGGAYKLSIGNPSGNHLKWDGTSLTVVGNITANGINIEPADPGSGDRSRMVIKNNVIKVYDSSGVLRVQLGDLSA